MKFKFLFRLIVLILTLVWASRPAYAQLARFDSQSIVANSTGTLVQPTPGAQIDVCPLVGVSSVIETGNTVIVTTSLAQSYVQGQVATLVDVGVSGYNGSFTITQIISNTTFTYSNPTSGLGASSGGFVSVAPCSPHAAIFSDPNGTFAAMNPFNADSSGNFGFYAAPSQTYVITITGAGLTPFTQYWTAPPTSTGNNSFTGTNSFSGTSNFNGPLNATSGGSLGGSFSGNPTFTGNPIFNNFTFNSATATLWRLNNILLVDGVHFTNLAAALAACVTSCWIIDNFPESVSSNPFAGFTALAKIDFGVGVWTVNSQIIVPATVSYFTGSGRAGTGATLFKAGGSMPINTPLIKALGTQGQVFSKFDIDCNGVAGSTGLFATDWNENSGVEKMAIVNCPSFGLNVDATSFTSIPAQNYFVRDLEVFPQASGSGTTVAVHLKGNGGGGPNVNNVTASGASGHTILASVQAENWSQGSFANIHGEFATNVWQNTTLSVSSFLIDNVTGTASDTNIVSINAASSANDFIIRRVSAGGATNSVLDGPRGQTYTDQVLTLYQVGAGGLGSEDLYVTTANGFQPGKNFLGTTAVGKLIVCPGCTPAGSTINNLLYLNTASVSPTAVTAQTCSDQTISVSGTVAGSDLVGQVFWPGALGNLSVSAEVPSNNNILLHFCNPSTASVTPPAGIYRFFLFR
jgi:hypothetical protein